MYANNNIVINTGNVLNIIDINKKAGQQVSEEVNNQYEYIAQSCMTRWVQFFISVDRMSSNNTRRMEEK